MSDFNEYEFESFQNEAELEEEWDELVLENSFQEE